MTTEASTAGGQGADTGAAATTTTAATTATTTTPAIDWLPNADEVTVGLVQNKGWKTPGDVLTSYTQLEKFVGTSPDKIVRLPTDTSTKEDLDSFYAKLGRPADPKEYKLPVPEGMPRDFADAAAGKFHELGLNTKQAQELTNWYNSQAVAAGTQSQEQKLAANLAQQEALKTEWGAAHDAELTKARLAASQFGVDAATLDKLQEGMGFDGVMKFFAKLGAKAGESDFPSGEQRNGAFGPMTPGQAKAEINTLKSDKEFFGKLRAGNAEAKAKWDQLHKYAFPDQ